MRNWKLEQEQRLDLALAEAFPEFDRATIETLVRAQAVLVNGTPARHPGQRLAAGDEISVTGLPEGLAASSPAPADAPQGSVLPIEVIYMDEALLVVDKPAGMALETTPRVPRPGLADALRVLCSDAENVGGVGRFGLVLRLEPEVSGLVLIARTEEVYRILQREARQGRVRRMYTALVEGELRGSGSIEAAIGHARHERQRMLVSRPGREAATLYRLQRHFKEGRMHYSLLEVQPIGSRQHQVRVHLAWYGFPVVGDRLYGRRSALLEHRLFLHLSALEFVHPLTDEKLRLESLLPAELYDVLRYLARPKK